MKKLFLNGQTVVFQGDSITDCQRRNEDTPVLGNGYPKKIAEIYKELFPDENINFINMGISGDTTALMLERYNSDFEGVNPDFISILIGINDVWRKYDSGIETTYNQFMQNYEIYLKKLKNDFPNAKIMIIEPFLLDTDPNKQIFHRELDPMIYGIRLLAKKYADYYLPLDGILSRYASTTCECSKISLDSVHPTPTGHGFIAYEYLKELEII